MGLLGPGQQDGHFRCQCPESGEIRNRYNVNKPKGKGTLSPNLLLRSALRPRQLRHSPRYLLTRTLRLQCPRPQLGGDLSPVLQLLHFQLFSHAAERRSQGAHAPRLGAPQRASRHSPPASLITGSKVFLDPTRLHFFLMRKVSSPCLASGACVMVCL